MPGHLAKGHRAGGRYRLEAELGRGERAVVWRATDETLERQVALRFFDPELDRALLVERAAVAASLTHPRVVRIFDTGFDGGQFFTVCELLPGSLRWASLPLDPEGAVRMAVNVAEALAYAHERGVSHGALHAGNVLLSEQGAKVADFATASVGNPEPVLPREDLVSLGELLAAALPPGDEPRGVTRVVAGLRDGAYDDARRALHDLQDLLPAPVAAGRRRWLPLIAGVTAVLLVVAGLAAARLGTRPDGTPRPEQPGPITGTPYEVASARDFDPLGDGVESSTTVRRLLDGNTTTFWSTERYEGGFPPRKTGVGVVIALRRAERVGRVRVLLPASGCTFELRTAASSSARVENWTVVATARNAATTVVLDDFRPLRSRYWLIWITKLTKSVPGAGRRLACGISDVAFYPP